MKFKFFTLIFIIFNVFFSQSLKTPLSHKSFNNDRPTEYERGIFLIVLANESLEPWLGSGSVGGDFIEFKKSQGYDVEIIALDQLNIDTNIALKGYLQNYKNNNPMLEYVLLVGDWNGAYAVPTFTIQAYNPPIVPDVTDYTYTYIGNNIQEPRFFIGRWPVRQIQDILILKAKTIEHTRLEQVADASHFDDALIVAGNFKDGEGVQPWDWPVTPVWTSLWLYDELNDFGYSNVDTVFYHAQNFENGASNPMISNSWNNGVGIVNYRGWGDANGWHKPLFHREEVEQLNNDWKLPIVLSFVCNTGDFGNDYSGTGLDKCFGETLITAGSTTNPKGAVAMIGPSDLDTDTRFNNVMCGAMWDEILEGRKTELGPALHSGKDSVRAQFDGLVINNTNIPDFYCHIYGVLGDPSIPIRITSPNHLNIIGNQDINESHLSFQIIDDSNSPVMDVVVALLYDNNLIGKDLSNQNGWIDINFENSFPNNSELVLYLNHQDYYQEKFIINFISDNGSDFSEHSYEAEEGQFSDYIYDIILNDDYNWVEISDIGTNLCLTDDTVTNIELPFDFNYYGNTYNSMTVSSNGWASFENCNIPYFWNFSIPFPMGPSAMLAPFMDDLDDNGKEPFDDLDGNCMYDLGEPYEDRNFNYEWDSGEEFDVFNYYDSANGRFIIQWDNVSNGEDDENCPDCVKETFQLILLDQAIHDNLVNQGDIIFIYQEIHDIDENGNFSTIGIESPNQNYGSQVIFNDADSGIISDLNNGYAIRFSADSNPLELIDINNNIEFKILETYPNPFNSNLNIEYLLIQPDYVNINIYDIKGNFIENIANFYQSSGNHRINWNAKNLSSGMYVIKLNVGSISYSNNVILLK